MSSNALELTSRNPKSKALIAIPPAEFLPSNATAIAEKPIPARKPRLYE